MMHSKSDGLDIVFDSHTGHIMPFGVWTRLCEYMESGCSVGSLSSSLFFALSPFYLVEVDLQQCKKKKKQDTPNEPALLVQKSKVNSGQIIGGINVLNTHPNLSIVISCCEAPAVPGESAASDAVLVAIQHVDTLPGLNVPQLGAEKKQGIKKTEKGEIPTSQPKTDIYMTR